MHNPLALISSDKRLAGAQNISFSIPLGWQIHTYMYFINVGGQNLFLPLPLVQ